MHWLLSLVCAFAIVGVALSTAADAVDIVGCGWITEFTPATATTAGK